MDDMESGSGLDDTMNGTKGKASSRKARGQGGTGDKTRQQSGAGDCVDLLIVIDFYLTSRIQYTCWTGEDSKRKGRKGAAGANAQSEVRTRTVNMRLLIKRRKRDTFKQDVTDAGDGIGLKQRLDVGIATLPRVIIRNGEGESEPEERDALPDVDVVTYTNGKSMAES